MTDAINVTQSEEDLRTLKDSFAHFGEPGYAFIPHKDPFWRQVFQRFRVVVLILLGTASFFALLQIYLFHREGTPDVRRLLKMTQIVVTEDCQNIRFASDSSFFDGETVLKCSLPLVQDIRLDPELAFILYDFIQFSDENRYINFGETLRGSSYLNLFSSTEEYNAFVRVYLHILTQEPFPKYIETPDVHITPEFWILDSQDHFIASYEFTTLYDYNSGIAFILFFSFLFAVFPGIVLFFVASSIVNRFLLRAPQVFYHLVQGNYLVPKKQAQKPHDTSYPNTKKYAIRPTSWQTFSHDLDNAITDSPWRVILFISSTIIIYTITILTGVQGHAFEQDSILYTFYMGTFFLVQPPFLAYILTQYIWAIYVIAQYIVWLPQYFDLRVDPDYEDRSGGLGSLGELFILMGLVIVPFALLAIVLIVSDFFLIFQLQGILIAIIFILAVVFILIFLIFLRPMLSIRRSMEYYKTAMIHEGRRLMRPLRDGLRLHALEGSLDSEEALSLREKLYTLETIYAPADHLPTLPFSSRSIVVYIGAQLFPLATITVTLIQLWQLIYP